MSVLVSLVKIGAIGASLAFLYLSYDLLKKELALPVGPRPRALAAISGLTIMALIFFIVGVLSEFMLTPRVMTAITERFISKELVRAHFYDWNFSPEDPSICTWTCRAKLGTICHSKISV
jgi:hypothetical protein